MKKIPQWENREKIKTKWENWQRIKEKTKQTNEAKKKETEKFKNNKPIQSGPV